MIEMTDKNGNITNKTEYVPNEYKILDDLQRVLCVVQTARPLFVVKDYDAITDVFQFEYLSLKEAGAYFGQINITEKHTVWTIYNKGCNKNRFVKLGMKFYSTRDDIFSAFQGYDYNILSSVNMDVISMYLDHIKNVICSGDETLYEYILNWYAYIVQIPDAKTEAALVLFGDQGTGKNIFTNVLCKIMKRYADPNVTDANTVVGQFNTALENKKLLVLNEMSDVKSGKETNFNCMKSVITDIITNINPKNINIRRSNNVANVIFVSNHARPVKLEQSDRRYVIINVSNCKKGNSKYFKDLTSKQNDSFYENLLTFFMNRDISEYNPRIIPMTEAKEDLLEASKPAIQLFYEEYKENFDAGFNGKLAYANYKSYCFDNGYKCLNNKNWGSDMKKFCIHKQLTTEGRPWVYITKDSV